MAVERRTLRIEKMEIAYDAARWSSLPRSENRGTMRAVGALAGEVSSVAVTYVPSQGVEGCDVLARRELQRDLYEEPKASVLEIAGLPAMRFTAHTRCRNATPMGVAICVPHAGAAYLLTSTIIDCRSGAGNPFGGPDPVHELTQGIRFIL